MAANLEEAELAINRHRKTHEQNLIAQSISAFKRSSYSKPEEEEGSLVNLNPKKAAYIAPQESSKENIRVSNEYRIKLIA